MAAESRALALAGWYRGALLRQIGVAAIAGGLAGMLVGGLGSRIAMRISGAMSDPALVGIARTNNGNTLGDITLGGTAGLLVFGAMAGILGGLVYVSARPWFAPLGRWRGLAYGLVLLAATGPLILEPFNIDFRKFGSPVLNVVLFASLFPLFGVALAPLTELVKGRVDGAGPGALRQVVTLGGLVGILFVLFVIAVVVVGPIGSLLSGGSGFAPADLHVLGFLYLGGAALVSRTILGRGRASTDARELPPRERALSYAVILLPAVLGVATTLEAITFLARP